MRSSRTLFFQTLGFAVLMVLLGLSVPGCINPPDYPDTPEIDFNAITIQPVVTPNGPFDKVDVTIDYRDGDGDLGLANDDIAPPFNPLPDGSPNPNRINYYCQTQIRQTDGSYLDFTPPGIGFNFNGTYPLLTPESQGDRKAPLSGKIFYEFLIPPNPFTPPGTVLRFRIYIMDRALHRSNEVLTDPITIPQ